MEMGQNTDLLLSICIPTHNRGSFLKETLASIVPQYNDSIEIVILDSASTDDTKNIIFEYQQKIQRLTYHYKNEKCGIDVDMAETVKLATGEYCWLMSSDDALTPDAIKILFEHIKNKYEILLCNRIVCDSSLNAIKDKTWLTKKLKKSIFNLSERNELLNYLHSAIEFGAIFSYMSSIIFKRKEWELIRSDETVVGTGYAHVMRIFSIISNNGSLKYIEKPLVLNRSFNDSFLEMGIVNRFMLDIDGYSLLANKLFLNDDMLKKVFLKVMLLEHPWYQLVKLRAYVDEIKWKNDIRQKLLSCGYSETVLIIAETAVKMKQLVKIAVRLRYTYNRSAYHKHIYLFKHYIVNLFVNSLKKMGCDL